MEKQHHTMDILFPLGVLAAFAASVITVLLMTATVYQGNVERSAQSFSGPTALAYLSEKMHQGDVSGSVRVGQLDGADALILTQGNGAVNYDTYIYCYDGKLRELMVNQELTAAASMGRELLDLNSLELEQLGEHLFRLSCTDENQTVREAYVALRSGVDE